jgi:uncharacterized protein YkwD
MEARARRWTCRAAVAALALLAGAPAAHAVPTVLSTKFDRGAVAGRELEFSVRARDAAAPVTGMVAGFGPGEEGFGLSSCLPPDSAGRVLEPAGRAATLTAPHAYGSAGVRQLAATVTSGGCGPSPATTLQRATVAVVPAGQAPRPLVVIPPVALPPLSIPQLPGLGLPPLPGGITLPGLGARTGPCPGSGDGLRNTRAGRRAARATLLCLVNHARRRRGLRAVRMNSRLTKVAQAHSRAMVRDSFFAHVGPGRRASPAYRLRRGGYIPRRGSWAIGENIGFGTGRLGSPLAIHRAWMHSTPHRHAILHPGFREVGFGVYRGAPYMRNRGVTYTVDFGVRH